MKADWGGILFLLGGWFLAPIFVAKVVIGADWISIAIAYLIWFALLGIFGLLTLLGGSSPGEAFGWPLILSLFLTILAVPIILLRW